MYASTHIFTELNPFVLPSLKGFFLSLRDKKRGYGNQKKTFMDNQRRVYFEVYPLTIRQRSPRHSSRVAPAVKAE